MLFKQFPWLNPHESRVSTFPGFSFSALGTSSIKSYSMLVFFSVEYDLPFGSERSDKEDPYCSPGHGSDEGA